MCTHVESAVFYWLWESTCLLCARSSPMPYKWPYYWLKEIYRLHLSAPWFTVRATITLLYTSWLYAEGGPGNYKVLYICQSFEKLSNGPFLCNSRGDFCLSVYSVYIVVIRFPVWHSEFSCARHFWVVIVKVKQPQFGRNHALSSRVEVNNDLAWWLKNMDW